jgi:hypothetical protein
MKLCTLRYHVSLAVVAFLVAFATMTNSGGAQTITGSIRGTVTDPSGAVVAGVNVTATDTGTSVKTSTVTNRQGIYNLQFLPIGEYTITVASPGFESSSIGPFGLEIDQIAKIDTKLKVGNASTTVDVASEVSPILQTQDATLGTTLSGNTMTSLPMNGLNFQFATLFVPGAVDVSLSAMGGADGNERDSDWHGTPSFNGNRGQANNYVLDGVEMNETMNNLSAYSPAPDAIHEMRAITGNANAEYGNVNGGEILIVTRGGTNKFHGSAYDFLQSNKLEANSFANNYAGVPLTHFTQNQFGVTVGGPILKDRLFFFGDYLGFRYHSGGEAKATVADAAMRTGDFSELLGGQYGNIQLYNNQNGAGFSNATEYNDNQIPINNPVAKFLFANPSLYPLPNVAPIPGQGDLDNYLGYTEGQTHNNQGDVRIDFKATSRDAIMGRYTYGDAEDFTSHPVVAVIFPSTNNYPFQNFVANWVHTFSASMVNEFRAGLSRTVWAQAIPQDTSGQFGTGGDAKIGIPFTNQAFEGFSLMNFGSFESNFGTQAIATEFHENNFYYGDDFTWQRGTHTIKFGAQIVRYQQNSYYPGNAGALGSFDYSGQYTENSSASNCGVGGNSSCPGYGFADFVMDQSTGAQIGGVAGPVGQRQYRNAYYAQDDWRVRSNLTVNLGLRYAHDEPLFEVNNKEDSVNLSNPSLGLAGIEFAGKDGNSRALYDPYYLEFMPRVGFSWQIDPRSVIRGGYGITDDFEGMGLNLRMTQNAPFLSSFSSFPTPPTATNSGQTPLPVENGFNLAPGALSVSYFDFNAWNPHIRPSLIQQFNLTWQVLIDSKTTAQIGYVGQLGQHLVVPQQDDQYSTTATGHIADGDCSGTIAPAAPFCNLVGNDGNLFETESEAFSNYHALQATLRRREANGLEFTFNYTWARSMTDNAGFYGVFGVAEPSSYFQNVYDPKGDYGPSGDDTRNSFNGYWIYELPFGHGKRFGSGWNRMADEAVGGWKFSGDVIMYSGFPLTMSSPENYYVNSFAAHAIHFRELRIVNRSPQHWFGTDPSAIPCLNIDANGNTVDNGTCAYGVESENGFGNAQNGSERAPGFRQVDLSAFKAFRITEGQSLQLRFEAFNALNLASYAPPDVTLGDYVTGRLGLITATNSSQRVMQVSLHYKF